MLFSNIEYSYFLLKRLYIILIVKSPIRNPIIKLGINIAKSISHKSIINILFFFN